MGQGRGSLPHISFLPFSGPPPATGRRETEKKNQGGKERMKQNFKRFLSWTLALLMALSLLPAGLLTLPAYAEELVDELVHDAQAEEFTVQATRVSVTFAAAEHGKYIVNDSEKGFPQTHYQNSTDFHLVAYPDEGYRFLGWYDDQGNRINDEKDTYIRFTNDCTITARFEAIQFEELITECPDEVTVSFTNNTTYPWSMRALSNGMVYAKSGEALDDRGGSQLTLEITVPDNGSNYSLSMEYAVSNAGDAIFKGYVNGDYTKLFPNATGNYTEGETVETLVFREESTALTAGKNTFPMIYNSNFVHKGLDAAFLKSVKIQKEATGGTVTGDFKDIVTECPAGVTVDVENNGGDQNTLLQNEAKTKWFLKATKDTESPFSPALAITVTIDKAIARGDYALAFDYAVETSTSAENNFGVANSDLTIDKTLYGASKKVNIETSPFQTAAINLKENGETISIAYNDYADKGTDSGYLTNVRIVKLEKTSFTVTLPDGVTATYSDNGKEPVSLISGKQITVAQTHEVKITAEIDAEDQCIQGFYRSGDTVRLSHESEYTFVADADPAKNKYEVRIMEAETEFAGYENLTVKTEGSLGWTKLADGSLASGNQMIAGSSSPLSITATKDGTLILDYKVSSETASGRFDEGWGMLTGDGLLYAKGTAPEFDGAWGDVTGAWDNSEEMGNFSGIMAEWKTLAIPVTVGETVYFLFCNDTPWNGGVTFEGEDTAWIRDIFLSSGKSVTVSVTADKEEYGTVSGDNLNQLVPEGSKQTYTATAKNGGQFYGWFDGSGKLLSLETTYTCVAKSGLALVAKFDKAAGDYEAWNMDKGELGELAAVVQAARSGDTVLLTRDTTLSTDLTIPAGVTLVVPCTEDDRGNDSVRGEAAVGEPPCGSGVGKKWGREGTLYRTLTIESGKTLTVNGTLVVNAVIGRQAAGHYDYDINGGYGRVVNNGTIDIRSGGAVDAFGLIEGENGNVIVRSGGTLTDLYVVIHWRGGSQAYAMFTKVYPMNEYKADNIYSTITVHSGGTYSGFVRMYASNMYTSTRFPQVDNSNGLIRLKDNATLIKKVDANGREHYTINGGADFSSSTLQILQMVKLSTKDYIYPINGTYDFVLKNGDYTFTESFKFLTGITMTTEKANLTVSEGKKVVFYDKFEDKENTSTTKYPARPAAYLVLSDDSTLTVNGAFAGIVKSGLNKGNIRKGTDASLTVATTEANGYCKINETDRDPLTVDLSFNFVPSTFPDYTGEWIDGVYTWTKDKYTITFVTDSGSAIEPITAQPGDAITLPTPVRPGYTFAGWYNGEEKFEATTMPAQSLTLKAHWTISQYTITFDTDGGSVIAPITQDYGTAITAPEDPTKAGYRFDGWDQTIPATMPAENVTVKATWTANTYMVSFDANGGSCTPASKSVTYASTYGDLPTPTREGYTFTGWYDGETKVEDTTTYQTAGDKTLTARWSADAYTVTYYVDNSKVTEQGYTYGASITPYVFQKSGYTVSAWKQSDGSALPAAMPAKNLSVYATTAIITYTISYELNGGTNAAGNPASYTVETDTITLGDPSKTGYTFNGWSGTELNGENNMTAVIAKGSTGDRSYQAHWTVNQYTITFDTDGGSVIAPIAQDYGTAITVPADPIKAGYRFDGWDQTIPATMPAENVTVKARWTSYLDLINAFADFEGKHLEIARGYYSKLSAAQKNAGSEKLTALIAAIRTDAVTKLKAEIAGKVGAANELLIQDGESIAKVAITGDQVEVRLIDEDYPARNLVNVSFLTTLFGDHKTMTVKVGSQEATGMNQMAIMVAVAYEAGVTSSSAAISALDGKQMPVVLTDTTDGDIQYSVTYQLFFFNNTHTLTWNTNGGQSTTTTGTYGQPIEAPPVSRMGYTFAGWVPQIPAAMGKTALTFTAQWTANTYTITFDANGGSCTTASKSVTYASTYGDLPVPTREGYGFDGWFTAQNDGTKVTGNDTVTITAGQTLYAHWKPGAYTITFDTDGGSAIDPITQDYGTKITAPAAPTKTGYTFNGWNPAIPETMPARNVTVKAKWTANQYTITFETDGGSACADITVTFGQTYGTLPTPEKAGYTFAGWYAGETPVTAETMVEITANQTLTAHWNAKGNTPYTVEYYQQNLADNDYTKVEEKSLSGQTDSTVEAEIVNYTGFTVNNEKSTTSGMVAGDGGLVLKVYYDRNTYQITWVVDGRETSATYRFGVTPTAPAAEKAADNSGSYTFTGWDKTPAPVTEHARYTAQFRKKYDAVIGETTYRTVALALEAAKTGETVTVQDGAVITESTQVPVGVLLLVPCMADDTGYSQRAGSEYYNPNGTAVEPALGANGTRYCTLTVAEGAALTVRGTLLVNAVTGRPQAGHLDQDINGGYGELQLNGTITVKQGGIFDSCGYTKGNGRITANAGGTVRDLYVVRSWRGGSHAAVMYENKIYPMNEYDMHNITAPIRIYAGAVLEGTVKMYAGGMFSYTRFMQIGESNGLIRLAEGAYADRTYDAKTARVCYTLSGGAAFSSSEMQISGVQVSTGDYYFPVDGDIDLVLEKGAYSINNDLKLLTGSTLTVNGDAALTVKAGAILIAYQQFHDPENTGNTQYPERPAAKILLKNGAVWTVNGGFAGKLTLDETEGSRAVVALAAEAATKLSSREANGYQKPRKEPVYQEIKECAVIEENTALTAGMQYSFVRRNGKVCAENRFEAVESSGAFRLLASAADGSRVIAAGYDAQGKMTGVSVLVLSAPSMSGTVTLPKGSWTQLRYFLLSPENAPVCEMCSCTR